MQYSNTITRVALAVAATCLTGLAFTQTPAPPAAAANNLQSIYRDALANDPTYAAARASQLAAIERTPQARSALLPQVTASAGYSRTRQNIEVPGTPDTSRTFSSWGPSLTLTQPLVRAQSWTALDQAKIAVTQADAALAQARQDLVLRVVQAYFDVLAAEDQLLAIGANKKAVSEQLAQARREFEVGTKTIVDTHEAQARFDQIVAQEQVARGDVVVKRNALRAITGGDPGTLVPLREQPTFSAPEPADVEAWAKRAEESSYGVAIARATSDIAQLESTRSRRGHWPTLDLSASVSDARNNGTTLTTADTTTRSSTIGVQLTVPIYSGGFTQSKVRESLALEEKARQDLETARRNAAQGARQAYTGVDFGLSQVRALESAEVSAKSQLDSTRLGYQVGVRINLDVLNATTQLFNTQRDLKKARYDFLVNGLRLKSAAGALDDPDVQRINVLLAR